MVNNSNSADAQFTFKGISSVHLVYGKYECVIAPSIGCSVLRLRDIEKNIEIFRYKDDITIDDINCAREIWGLPTLYLPNRFDKGVLKTSDCTYQLPINEAGLNNFIHGWVHKREHTIVECFSDSEKSVLKTSYTFNNDDEMYSCFPIDFKISYTFTLSADGLKQEICLENNSDRKLPVSICTHTCMNSPMTADGDEAALRLCVPIGEKCGLDERCLPTEKLLPLSDWDEEYAEGTKKPVLQNISNDMYTARMNKLDGKDFYGVVITDNKTGNRVCNEVSAEYKFWNMWNDEGNKGYFCPEPMTAMINSANLSLPDEITGYSELAKDEKYICWQRFFTL